MWISFLVAAQWCSIIPNSRGELPYPARSVCVCTGYAVKHLLRFLAVNSRFNASGDGVAQLGRSLDVDANTNGQVVIRDSAINEGFNTAKPWADAVISNRPFAGNTGSVDDNDEVQRNLNDTNYNRMWEYNNRGLGSKVIAEPKS